MTTYIFFVKDVNLEYINLKIGCVALAQHEQARRPGLTDFGALGPENFGAPSPLYRGVAKGGRGF